ncbi:MAG: tetratricopeptide repeat protein [Planctomycetota bacterium]|nr:tetratricopeptide repeat protein [Planctomycetota bacterium]
MPTSPRVHPAVEAALAADWLTDRERAELRVFHGLWTQEDLLTPTARARVALNAWRFDDPALADGRVPTALRAQARLLAGDLREAIALVENDDSITADRIRIEALEALGDYDAAARAAASIARRLEQSPPDDAAALTEGARAMAIRARLTGPSTDEYRRMMSQLARAGGELDRLYWPARLAEAELLLEKHNDDDAIVALHETLSFNPRCAQAFRLLGQIALSRFDFESAREAIDALRALNPRHPLADLLCVESRLVQNDPEEALYVVRRLTDRLPRLRAAHALAAAATALLYEEHATRAALDRYDELSPGSAEAYLTAGSFLAKFRQYEQAAVLLEEAIRRQPAGSEPRLALALMEMQTGRDDRALMMLRSLIELDPFNRRAANSLHLLEELADYAELETEHFIIRYEPGVDAALAELMPRPLERIHETVVGRFGWTPRERTIIELMPDHQRFAVRITGMPHVHTIAACTGPIIALEAPREGRKSRHHGTFDWVRVIRHEYTHTVTLQQTKYRIPHWLTEAAAVSMELAPREYGECVMLADSWRAGTLFDLDQIKWAFVRPRKRGDRGKAYAQGHWMLQFMEQRFGRTAVIDLLERYFHGEREEKAITGALGVSPRRFLAEFNAWAGGQVESWGLAPRPSMTELADRLRFADPELALVMAASQQARLDAVARTMADRIGRPASPEGRSFTADRWPELVRPPVQISDEQLAQWRREYPDHPDLLKEEINRRLRAGDDDQAALIPRLERYAELRPVDLFPHRRLARIHLASDTPQQAVRHLEELDAREEESPVYAWRLAGLYRRQGDVENALAKITRAVQIDAYDADQRELAAAIALEAGRLDLARLHVRALTLLEPDRPQHRKRLQRIDELLAAEP